MSTSLTVHGLGIDATRIRTMYYYMVLSRAIDDRAWILARQGVAPFVITGHGQEGGQAGVAAALDPAVDWITPYYRDMVIVLMWGVSPREVMLGTLARAADPASGGRQMPNHWGSRRRRILSGSSPVTTQVTHAAGLAWALKLQHRPGVVATFLGDGSTNQGEFHEALNWASVFRLPLLVVVENNGWAISVPQSKSMAVEDIAVRAAGYGIPGVVVQGIDPLGVYQATAEARRRALAGEGPTLIEIKTHRLTAHSSDDDDRVYKSAALREQEKAADPIPRFREWMEGQGLWDGQQEEELRRRVQAEVDDATSYALAAAQPDPATLYDHVYAD
ncbi:branched-chain alpha-keto acid dehydrogenase E1 subunit [Candidatus Hydrogenisulfobacillus filiaventi]|uniref:2-oxoisovalerate dehydrogenase subunit alpha n=1 Tax=Candidatus Hydrogenisulfobacillus filiaventi TaxID=2707344 RepID=A0A6F8ZKC6_9FIRM|nr:thiamine pyrophosphate-dependent dehydrogenase E1 component subunit alpha [Bacillota bacterium]CAB1130248.1 branched-chain alpha-keto acid dehydrogenase E1 subunit [Candidatus Hydrogenisulfobacillus filiaventi]